ncbi:MAG: Glutathione-regulated potassium-efflux system protein KefC [Nitrospirae bacterium]|nr:MAG: TrkA family potassium uptake protein [Nitrospira sp. OLB3]MBV6468636.1 Glutathione-regulated potassium-efflux system protein KefC [Nitrospirota bacterium]MCE7966277.1 potassium channel protein [Nitrospira sp. NTP2]MCK6491934.1 potassium channel family protein [Nitrospira sp.]RIK60635.1 MAG: potassium channel protein [Nitrospira sp.]
MAKVIQSGEPRVIITPDTWSPFQTLTVRFGLALLLFLLVFLLLWLDRDGLQDQIDGHVSLADVLYFTMITITTVGYGDIVPVSTGTRLLDALVITPARLVIWFLFLGTAYQLIIRQYMEGYRMAKLRAALNHHLIICGFGHTGQSTVKELLARGTPTEQIVVIDQREERVRLAGSMGVAAFQADAAQETVLKDAAIHKAKAVIISAGRDDSNALMLLTARHLNPTVRIIVSAKQEENVKLLRQGGADAIVSPATFGGYILAAAVDHGHMVHYLNDLLTAGGHIRLIERPVRPEEVGKRAEQLKPDLLLQLYRGTSMIPLFELDRIGGLQQGDILVLLTAAIKPTHATDLSS